MKSACVFALLIFCSLALCAQNPVPLVNNPLVPSSALPGGLSFTLTVNGTAFVAGSTVDWNGAALPTTFVSGSQLTATVPAANIATAGTASVTVVSPAPGGGMSNVSYFAVRKPFPAVAFGETEVPAGNNSSVPIAADFNGDGKLDVASLSFTNDYISVVLGNGDGTFQPVVEYPVGNTPAAMIVGDVNGDGNLDLVEYDLLGTVSALLGNGDGTFQNRLDSPSIIECVGAAAGDFNGDGKLDLALVMEFGQVAITLGNGDGRFQAPVTYTLGSAAASVAVGDFNSDGKLDLAVTSGVSLTGGFVAIFLGNGDGTFQAAVDYSTAADPHGVVVADFNGDAKLDMAIKGPASGGPGTISLLLGNGDGSFQAPITYDSSNNDIFVTAADLNGDGRVDLVIPTSFETQVLLGTGDGHLGPLGLFPSAKFGLGSDVGDFNGDGLIDVVVGSEGDTNVYVLPQLTSVLSETLTYFGSVKLGKSKTRQVTLMNYGDKVLSIDRIGVQGDDASVFSETNTCGSGVQPGASCKIAITFTPQRPRQYTMARVAIRDSATRLSQKIMLEGMGLK